MSLELHNCSRKSFDCLQLFSPMNRHWQRWQGYALAKMARRNCWCLRGQCKQSCDTSCGGGGGSLQRTYQKVEQPLKEVCHSPEWDGRCGAPAVKMEGVRQSEVFLCPSGAHPAAASPCPALTLALPRVAPRGRPPETKEGSHLHTTLLYDARLHGNPFPCMPPPLRF